MSLGWTRAGRTPRGPGGKSSPGCRPSRWWQTSWHLERGWATRSVAEGGKVCGPPWDGRPVGRSGPTAGPLNGPPRELKGCKEAPLRSSPLNAGPPAHIHLPARRLPKRCRQAGGLVRGELVRQWVGLSVLRTWPVSERKRRTCQGRAPTWPARSSVAWPHGDGPSSND